MKIGIAGLGLIGGSLAKAAKRAGHGVLAWNRSPATLARAVAEGAADGPLDADSVRECAAVFVALPPDAVAPWIDSMAASFAPGTVVSDCAGVKRSICAQMLKYATGRDWTFLGGHPMAGKEKGGYGNSSAGLFDGASMIFTPYPSAGRRALDMMDGLARSLGFARTVFATPEEHDAMIAVTSQMAHAVSCAYARDPLAPGHSGFSAGSFADMTRVASVDPPLWTGLFMANRDNLAAAVRGLEERLAECRRALEAGDAEAVRAFLEKGRDARAKIVYDGVGGRPARGNR